MIPRAAALGAAILALTFVLGGAALAAEPSFSALTGRVVDDAKILSATARTQLDAKLAQHETATGEQVVVATVPSLQGVPIEDYGYQLGRAWGIGQKGKNNGAILLVAPKEHAVRIEVGYGLEGTLTDAASRGIIERDILPAFRKGDMERGVVDGTDAILAVLAGGSAPKAGAVAPAEQDLTGTDIVVVLLIVAIFLFFFIRILQGHGGGWVVAGGSSYSGRSGGFSSGGSSFSGGGGSFGGGGASGQW